MQPLKTYEVTLTKVRTFSGIVRVNARSAEDAKVLAAYEYVFPWEEDHDAENVYPDRVKEIDLEKTLAHYTAQAEEAKTIPGMETEA
jgi:hypothetical protein